MNLNLKEVLNSKVSLFDSFSGQAQNRDFCCHWKWTKTDVQITVRDDMPTLFIADSVRGITISSKDAEGISRYAGLSICEYHSLATLLGIVVWRALCENPLLRNEDLLHEYPEKCLFTIQPTICEYTLLLEQPYICEGCIDLFRCLGAETEMFFLRNLIHHISSSVQTHSFPASKTTQARCCET